MPSYLCSRSTALGHRGASSLSEEEEEMVISAASGMHKPRVAALASLAVAYGRNDDETMKDLTPTGLDMLNGIRLP